MDGDANSYLTKAQESLASAESELLNARYNSCANRCYYACFQAVIGALLIEGIQPTDQWGHRFVQSQFAGQLIYRRKRYASTFRNTLVDTFELRQMADYDPTFVTRAEARQVLAQTQTLVRAITERANE